MGKNMKKFVIICLLLMVASIGGICATWQFSEGQVAPISTNNDVVLADLYYPENVPDDPDADLSHNTLLQLIVSETVGINNPNSLLSQSIDKRLENSKDNVCSSQQVTGGNLKNTFGNVPGYEYVGFLIVMREENEYDIYTYDHRDAENINSRITVYHTRIVKDNGEWVLRGGREGSAIATVYDDKTNGKYKNTIAHSTFILAE